jgi:hypothetical protein
VKLILFADTGKIDSKSKESSRLETDSFREVGTYAKYLSLKIKKSPFTHLREGKVRLTLVQPATENSEEGKTKQRTEIEEQYSIFSEKCKNTEYCLL